MIERLVDLAMELNKENKDYAIYKKYDKIIHPVAWMKQYCTIHINISRASGKTKYIGKKATINDIVIVSNRVNGILVRDNNIITNIMIVHFDGLQNFMINNKNKIFEPEFVYVDEPSRTLNKNKDFDIYNYFSYCKNSPTFILLGE